MILWLRFFISTLRAFFQKSVDPFQPYKSSFRSFPFLDSEFKFMNASRYYSFCELTVNEANVRSGFLKIALRNGIIGTTTNCAAHYHRPINNLRKFQVTTHLLGWDDKAFYRKFQISQNNELKFEALYRIALVGRGKTTPTEALVKMGYAGIQSPTLPDEAKFLQYRIKSN